MSNSSFKTDLEILKLSSKKRSKAARLDDLFDDIESAIAKGIGYEEIIILLAKHDLEFTHNSFKNTLARLRKKRSKVVTPVQIKESNSESKPNTDNNANNANNAKEDKEALARNKSSDPRELDKIFNGKHDLVALAKLAKRNKP